MEGEDTYPENQAHTGDPDAAWRTLGLVNEWVKHAETKATLTITANGVMATVLYNTVKEAAPLNDPATMAAVLTGYFITLGALLAAVALWPRLAPSAEPTNALYFNHIADKYYRPEDTEEYVDHFRKISMSDSTMFSEVSTQVWANSHVASLKFKWASIGLALTLLGLGSLACTLLATLIS